jgi:hypothetical protein
MVQPSSSSSPQQPPREHGEKKVVQFEKNEVSFKQNFKSFVKKMTTPGDTYAKRLQAMTPQERLKARENLRSKIKWASYSFVVLVIASSSLYSQYLGTEESRMRYNIRKYLYNEELEVQQLRKEIEELEKQQRTKISKA